MTRPEVAAPQRSLPHAIALHRALSQAEIGGLLRLHVRDGESGIGPPFAQPFEHYLDARYGVAFPWSAGLKALRADCRRTHSDHWARPEWRGSLCYRLVHLVVRDGYSFERACYELVCTPERTERTILRAFRRIEQKLDELQARETEVVKSSEGRHDFMAAPHVHRPLDGLHRVDCPQCRRAAA